LNEKIGLGGKAQKKVIEKKIYVMGRVKILSFGGEK